MLRTQNKQKLRKNVLVSNCKPYMYPIRSTIYVISKIKNRKPTIMIKDIKVCKPCKSTQTGTKWIMGKKITPDAWRKWGHYKILKLSSIGAQECQKTKQNQKTKKKKKTKKHLKRKCSEVKKNKNKNIEKLWETDYQT